MPGMLDYLLATLQGQGAPMGMPPSMQLPNRFGPLPGADDSAPADPTGMGMPGYSPPADPYAAVTPKAQMPGMTPQAPVPGVDAVAGLLSGMRGTQGADSPQQWNQPPSTNDPLSGEPKLDVPLPRARPSDLGGGDDAQASAAPGAPLSLSPQDYADRAPDAATPAEGRTSAAAPAEPGFLETLGKKIFDPNKAATWLALGGGFAGAGSVGTGMRRAFSNAVPAMAADRAQIMKQSSIADTYRALVAKGVPASEALAASQNPDIMKAVAGKYFEAKPRVPHKIGTDFMGNDIMGSFDPNTGRFFDAAGAAIARKGDGSGGISGIDPGAGMLAKGVTEINQDLPAEEYKAQFSPGVQAEMENYAHGDTMPTGNPRIKGSAGKIKEWTQLWGKKAGVDVSDSAFSEKRKFRTEEGSTAPATYGGASKAFNQGTDHAHSLTKTLLQLDNSSGFGIPALARGVNTLRQAFSTRQSSIAAQADALGQTLAGEVGKLFSGTAGGGVHERELTRERFKTIKSPEELAGALEGTLETMEGGKNALDQHRLKIMGSAYKAQDIVTDKARQQIAEIRQMIKALRGEAPDAAAPSRLEPGASTTINGVTIKRLN